MEFYYENEIVYTLSVLCFCNFPNWLVEEIIQLFI